MISCASTFTNNEKIIGYNLSKPQKYLMPDILQFFGITKIHNLHSMSNMKYNAIVKSGIEVVNRISIPPELIPQDAQVEIEAKKAAGYFTNEEVKKGEDLEKVKGRPIDE